MMTSMLRFAASMAAGVAGEDDVVGAEFAGRGELDSDVVKTFTSAPIALASFTAMWPRPPRPTTPTTSPSSTSKWRSGEKVVMPAQSSGAAAAGSRLSGTRRT